MSTTISVGLPTGFSLCEEEDFVYLLFGDEKIASFYCAFAHPDILQSVAEAYMAKGKH